MPGAVPFAFANGVKLNLRGDGRLDRPNGDGDAVHSLDQVPAHEDVLMTTTAFRVFVACLP